MKKITLTTFEVDSISLFIDDVVAIPCVEAIYLLACKRRIFGDTVIDVVTVYNNSLAYNNLLTNNEGFSLDFDKMYSELSCRQIPFSNSRLNFISQNSNDFLPFILNAKEKIAKRDLARGTILFDRFGHIKKKQMEAKNELGISSDIKITNIDEIVQEERTVVKIKETTNK